MKRRSFLAGTAAAAGLATTGCGNLATSDPNTITFMFRGSIDERAAYNEAIAEFERQNDVTVNVIVTNADQYDTKLQAAILGRKTPDVFYFDSGKVKAYAINDVLQDLTPYLEGTGAAVDELWPLAVDLYRYDGETQGEGDSLYGLPPKDIGPFSFGYNRTMFEEAGIELPDPEVPYTWERFAEVCQELTRDTDDDGQLDQWGTGLNVTWNLQALVWSNGADWSDEAATTVTVDTPGVRRGPAVLRGPPERLRGDALDRRVADPGHLPALDAGPDRLLPGRSVGPVHLPRSRLRLGPHPPLPPRGQHRQPPLDLDRLARHRGLLDVDEPGDGRPPGGLPLRGSGHAEAPRGRGGGPDPPTSAPPPSNGRRTTPSCRSTSPR